MTTPENVRNDAEADETTSASGVFELPKAASQRSLCSAPESSPSLWSERSGRTIQLQFDGSADVLTIAAPDGAVELSLRLTASGPVLELHSARLQLTATREVEVTCGRFAVNADAQIELRGHAMELEARLGGIEVRANDDVVVTGERICLNP